MYRVSVDLSSIWFYALGGDRCATKMKGSKAIKEVAENELNPRNRQDVTCIEEHVRVSR